MKEILKTIPRETLEHFKETYGEKDLTLKKNGDLSWRSSRNKELLKEYLENIGPTEHLKHMDPAPKESLDPETQDPLKTLCTDASTTKGSGTSSANLVPNSDFEEKGLETSTKKRKESPAETIDFQKNIKLNFKEEAMKDIKVEVKTDNYLDMNPFYTCWDTSADELLNRIRGVYLPQKVTKEIVADLLAPNGKFRKVDDKYLCLQVMVNSLLLNIDDRLRLLEGKSTNELETKGKIQNFTDGKDVLTSKKSNEKPIYDSTLMNQIQKSIDNLTNKDKELSTQVKLLMESRAESEKSQKHQLEKLSLVEANLKVAREELEKLHSKSLLKVETLSNKLSSEINSCQRDLQDRETSFNQKLSILERNLSKTAEDLKGRMEIEGEVKYNDNKFQILVQKLQDDFEKFTLDVKSDWESHKSDINKEKEFLKESQKILRDNKVAQPNNAVDLKIIRLEKLIDDLQKRLLNSEKSPTEESKAINALIEGAQQDILNLEAKLIESIDAINTTIIPFIIGINKNTQVLTQRIDSYWKSRENNKYLKKWRTKKVRDKF